MKNQTILIATVTLLVGGIGGYILANSHHHYDWGGYGKDGSIPMGMHRMADGTFMGNNDTAGNEEYDYGMMGGMDHMDMMVRSEREFLEGMIPHHQEAVDTAKEVIERGGTTPEIKALVENIVVAQEKEIADMKSWYEAWYGVPYTDNGKYRPMMRELENLSGSALDKVFLEDMIMHHMGAIMMARSVQPYVEHSEIETLTKAIVSTQSEEIVEMRQMLREL